MLKEVLLP